ncbi:hypothetical protein TWF481_000213 [Arthrobotrys musiformis]|uniref:Uncharacterized protein n=1 Tax=Arthrobotrys musiformis TaxID=47236 RepID=A0AAV9WN40_9PEZI
MIDNTKVPLLFSILVLITIFHFLVVDSRVKTPRGHLSSSISSDSYIPTTAGLESVELSKEDAPSTSLETTKNEPNNPNSTTSASRSLLKRGTRKRKRPLDPDHEIIPDEGTRQRRKVQSWYRESVSRGSRETLAEYRVPSGPEKEHIKAQIMEHFRIETFFNATNQFPSVSLKWIYKGFSLLQDILQKKYRRRSLVYSGFESSSESYRLDGFNTFLSLGRDHFFVFWEGYKGNLGQEANLDSRIKLRMPDMLYVASGATSENPAPLKYVNIMDIRDIHSIEIAREVISRILPPEKGKTSKSLSLHFEEINPLEDTNPKKTGWLAILGLPEVATVVKMLRRYPEAFVDNIKISDINIWHYDVLTKPNSIYPSLAIMLGLELDFPDDIIRAVYAESVRKGSYNLQQEAKIETDPDPKQSIQSEDPPLNPLPQKMEMDISWSGGQEYPFAAWVKSLDNPRGSERVFLKSGRSYKKVHLKERLQYDRSRTVFWSTVSAQDKHLAYWWTPDVIEKGSLVDWMYRCWVAGSQPHPEPEIYPDLFHQALGSLLPTTNLKYITIWDVHSPETTTILQQVFEKVYPDPADLFTQTLHLSSKGRDEDPLRLWPALLGTKEIGSILQMCIQYQKGMRGAKISDIEVVFQLGEVGLPLRASVIVTLGDVEDPTSTIRIGDINDLAFLAEEGANMRLNDLKPKRLQIQVTHNGISYHPSQAVLEARTSYRSSKNPSYIQILTKEPSGWTSEYSYGFAISSQENHIFLKYTEDVSAGGELELNQLLKAQYLENHLGEILFSTWFSQEGWSKIKEITFGTASDSIKNFASILRGRDAQDFNLRISNDGSDDFQDLLKFFFEKTLEGKSIAYLLNSRPEFLVWSGVQLLEIISAVGGPGAELLLFVRFGEQLLPNGDEPIEQVMERHLLTRSNMVLLRNMGYVYEPMKDKAMLSSFQFHKSGIIKSPIGDLPPEIIKKMKHNTGSKLTNTRYLSTSVAHKSNSLFYEIAASQHLGNVVVTHLPEETQLPEKLSNFVFTRTEDGKYRDRTGIRAVTFLDFSPETKRVLAEIRSYFSDEIDHNGFIELRYPLRIEDVQIFDKRGKGRMNTFFDRRETKMWLTLLGTPEVSAVSGLYPLYQGQMDRKRHLPMSVYDISIVWLPTENEETDGERPVLLINLYSGSVDGNTNTRPYQNYILGSQLRDIYLFGVAANFRDRYCGLANPLPDSRELDPTIFTSEEIAVGMYYEFTMDMYRLGVLKFPWRGGLKENVLDHIDKLEDCDDYSSTVITKAGEGIEYELEVSKDCSHLALRRIPPSAPHINASKSQDRRRELAAAYFAIWKYRFPDPMFRSPGLGLASLEYVSIEELSLETVEILNFMGRLWEPSKLNLKKTTPPIVHSKHLRLSRATLFHGDPLNEFAWNLLLGSLEIGAIADMIRLYPTSLWGQRIEDIFLWPTETGTIRALVRISKADR